MPAFIEAGLRKVMQKLARFNPLAEFLTFESFNFYNCFKQRIRANPQDHVLAQGTFTVGLGLARGMVTDQQWNYETTKQTRFDARAMKPERQWRATMKEINTTTSGIRLEYTVRLNIRCLAKENRNWSVIKRVIERAASRPGGALNLAEREVVAIAERLLYFASSGSPRVNLALFDSCGLRKSLSRWSFPYIDPEIVNLWTGKINFARYHPDENRDFAHVAALRFRFNKVVGNRANGMAEIERTAATAGDVEDMSDYALKHVASHFVKDIMIPEFRKAARNRYLAKARDTHKKRIAAAAGDEHAIEEAHRTMLAVLHQLLGPFPENRLFVATLIDADGKKTLAELPKDFFHDTVVAYTSVAMHILLDVYQHLEMVVTAEVSSLKSPPNQTWPALLRELVKLEAQTKVTVGTPPATVSDLRLAIADAMIDHKLEVWPGAVAGRLNGSTTWLKLHFLSIHTSLAVDASPHVAKRRKINGNTEVIELDDNDDPFDVAAGNGLVVRPPVAQMTDLQRICRSVDLRFDIEGATQFPQYWTLAKADFRKTLIEKVESNAQANVEMNSSYLLRWDRILNSFDPRRKSHWASAHCLPFIYTIARVYAWRVSNLPWLKEPGPVSVAKTHLTRMFHPEPPKGSLQWKRSTKKLFVLFIAMLLYYQNPDLQHAHGGECEFRVLTKGWTDKHFDTGIYACLRLGEQHSRCVNQKFPPAGDSAFTPHLSEAELGERFVPTALHASWDNLVKHVERGDFYHIFRLVYVPKEAVEFVSRILPGWKRPAKLIE
ncbi:hypothetical protein Rhopal_002944-T1 [Rhodotorula paludigena]|uniref:Uncharacterized protein n=1 Tax=Rhodotorula paludigena TaxID=86838 RepID=A0AAV5GKD1_9BASI|nr:hypothetical protein Rhopal_002944-T1 [Rhodotorula paludigena]